MASKPRIKRQQLSADIAAQYGKLDEWATDPVKEAELTASLNKPKKAPSTRKKRNNADVSDDDMDFDKLLASCLGDDGQRQQSSSSQDELSSRELDYLEHLDPTDLEGAYDYFDKVAEARERNQDKINPPAPEAEQEAVASDVRTTLDALQRHNVKPLLIIDDSLDIGPTAKRVHSSDYRAPDVGLMLCNRPFDVLKRALEPTNRRLLLTEPATRTNGRRALTEFDIVSDRVRNQERTTLDQWDTYLAQFTHFCVTQQSDLLLAFVCDRKQIAIRVYYLDDAMFVGCFFVQANGNGAFRYLGCLYVQAIESSGYDIMSSSSAPSSADGTTAKSSSSSLSARGGGGVEKTSSSIVSSAATMGPPLVLPRLVVPIGRR